MAKKKAAKKQADRPKAKPEVSPRGKSSPTIVRVPSAIGGVCVKESDASAAMQNVLICPCPLGTESGMLVATDGRMAAAVLAEVVIGDGHRSPPRWLPAEMATPGREGAREVFWAMGTEVTLFGRQQVWVDDERRRYNEVPMDVAPLPVIDVLPAVDDSWVALSVNAEMLLRLARALNSPASENGPTSVTLMLKPGPEGKVSLVAALGDVGAGVLMCRSCDNALAVKHYTEVRKRAKEATGSMPTQATARTEESKVD